jgi:hypothetical protein
MLDLYKNSPVLEEVILNLDKGTTVEARGGLLMIAGNDTPYFSLTFVERDEAGKELRSGAWGEEQRDIFPDYDDLYRLIGCDIQGTPLHAEKNGWYWLGMTPTQFFVEERVCQHFRIEALEANYLRSEIMQVLATPTWWVEVEEVAPIAPAWEFYLDWVEKQRGRWNADAVSAIKAHDLVVFGDPWPA